MIHGKDIIIYEGDENPVAIAASKSCTVDKVAGTIETSSPASGVARSYASGRTDWVATLNNLVLSVKDYMLRVGETYYLTIGVRGSSTDTISGYAICTECNVTGTVGNLAQGSFRFQGSDREGTIPPQPGETGYDMTVDQVTAIVYNVVGDGYLSRLHNDTAQGLITFNAGAYIPVGQYLRIGDAYLTYDAEYGMLKVWDGSGVVERGLYATGSVSALGAASGGGGGGGGGGDMDRDSMFAILSGAPASASEWINAKFLKLGPGLAAASDGTLTITGAVTSVGLTMPTGFTVSGSPITSSGVIAVSLASGYKLLQSSTATPGTYTKVTVDTYGRVTDGSTLSSSDIPVLPASKVPNIEDLDNFSTHVYDAAVNRTANTVLAGPSSGSASPATFRALVAADIPTNISITGNAATATTASKLGTSTVGSAIKGIYLSSGTAIAMTYELNATVNSGTSNYFAYFSGTNEVSSTQYLRLSSSRVIATTGLTVGQTSANTSYPLYVNGNARMTRLYLAAGVYLEYDSTNGAIHVVGAGLYSDTFISALGSNGGGGGGGSFDVNAMWDALATNDSTKIINVSHIPNLSASKITSGTFASSMIPDLDASKITSGTFSTSRIPTLSISKISGLQSALDSKVGVDSNVASATKLQTARTLWGQSFDGTANVKGTITSDYFKLNDNASNPYLQFSHTYSGTDYTYYVQAANGHLYLGQSISSGKYLLINSSGNVILNSVSRGYFLTDSAGNSYPLGYNNTDNLWIGSLSTASTHHVGQTFISAGYNASTGTGNPTIRICVPNANNDNGTNYYALHSGNYSTYLDDVYVNVTGDTMTGDLTIHDSVLYFTGGAAGRKAWINKNGTFLFQTTTSGGWATGKLIVANDGSTSIGYSDGAFGSANTLTYYFYGGNYDSPWVVLKPNSSATFYMGVGLTNPTQKLHVSGNILATGGVTALSDIRKKSVITEVNTRIEDIAKLPAFYYKWKFGIDDDTHIGTSAQDVQALFPELVIGQEELSVNYGVLGTTIGILLSKRIIELGHKVMDLEEQIKELKNKNSCQ